MTQTHPLFVYLRASNESLNAFAARLGVGERFLRDLCLIKTSMTLSWARLISRAIGGGVSVDELIQAASDEGPLAHVVDFNAHSAMRGDKLDRAFLAEALHDVFKHHPELLDVSTENLSLIVEAIENTYVYFGDAPMDSSLDRLRQSLLLVLQSSLPEILGRQVSVFPSKIADETLRLYSAL